MDRENNQNEEGNILPFPRKFEGRYYPSPIMVGSHRLRQDSYEVQEDGSVVTSSFYVRVATRGTYSTEVARRNVIDDPEMKEFLLLFLDIVG